MFGIADELVDRLNFSMKSSHTARKIRLSTIVKLLNLLAQTFVEQFQILLHFIKSNRENRSTTRSRLFLLDIDTVY